MPGTTEHLCDMLTVKLVSPMCRIIGAKAAGDTVKYQ